MPDRSRHKGIDVFILRKVITLKNRALNSSISKLIVVITTMLFCSLAFQPNAQSQPLPLYCYGGYDSTGGYWNLLDHLGYPLADSDWVYVAWAGWDGEIDPPDYTGDVSGDDVILQEDRVVYSSFLVTATTWESWEGLLIYCRLFDDPKEDIVLTTCYSNSQLYEIQHIWGEEFYCVFPGDPGGGHTDTQIYDGAFNDLTINGGMDTTGQESWPLRDIHGQQLEDGDMVQLISTGADGFIDPLDEITGLPSGDDSLLVTWGVGLGYGESETGCFRYTTHTLETDPLEGYLTQGDRIYVRVFDDDVIGEGSAARWYGESDVYQVIYQPAETFYSFADSSLDAVNPAPWYRTLAICGGVDSAMTEHPLTDAQGVLLEDGDLVQVIWAGPDGMVDEINEVDGYPSGDDSLLTSASIHEGIFQVELQTFNSPQWGRPAIGDDIYLRIFNSSSAELAVYYGESEAYSVLYQQGEAYLCFSDDTDDAVYPLHQILTIYGGMDSSMAEHPLTDSSGVMLEDGDLVQLIWAGHDGDVDVIDEANGMPTGDDSLLISSAIGSGYGEGTGLFRIVLPVFSNHVWGLPAAGDIVYLRVFDDFSAGLATHYGESDVHTVTYEHGVSFFSFPDDADDAVNPLHYTITIFGGMDSSMVEHPLTDSLGVMLEDGDLVQLIWAGPDGNADPIGESNGLPTGDDSLVVLLSVGTGYGAGTGLFQIHFQTFTDHGSGFPAQGDGLFLRIFSNSICSRATHYGQSEIHPIVCEHGENFYAFPDDADDAVIPNPCLFPPPGSDLVWGTFLGGAMSENGYAIALDCSANVYVSGNTFSSDFPVTSGAYDPTNNNPYIFGDVFLAKLDKTGSQLLYSTFLGGNSDEVCKDIVVDDQGHVYMTGTTISWDFPTTPGAFDTHLDGYGEFEYLVAPFLLKFNQWGNDLEYSTYLEGADARDYAKGIAVDGSGCAYVAGYTWSPDFPATPGAFDTTYNGSEDVFVAKINQTGTALEYCTFLGGHSWEENYGGIDLDSSGCAYVTGYTYSEDFPTTPGAFDTTSNGASDVFLVKLNSAGSALEYASFFGGSNYDIGCDVAIDRLGYAYLVGRTKSEDFPVTGQAFDGTYNGDDDAFIAKLSTVGQELVYSTYLGGTGGEWALNISLDAPCNAYVTGYTGSADFPTSEWGLDRTHNGGRDIFMARISSDGARLDYSTFLGGEDNDTGEQIRLDEFANVYIVGSSVSNDFPVTGGAFDETFGGNSDAVVCKMSLEEPSTPVESEGLQTGVPEVHILDQNYPDPFNSSTRICYQLPRACHVTMKIFNILGQQVRSLADEYQHAGDYTMTWDGKDRHAHEVDSGIYFCRLQAGEYAETVKMVLLR